MLSNIENLILNYKSPLIRPEPISQTMKGIAFNISLKTHSNNHGSDVIINFTLFEVPSTVGDLNQLIDK